MTDPPSGPGHAVPSAPYEHAEPGLPRLDVPVTVWPGLPATARCDGPVSGAVAERVIAVFSRSGDLVAAVDGSAAVIEAAAAAGRRVLGLVPAGDDSALPEFRSRLDSEARPFARMRSGGLALLLAAGDPDAGRAALAITACAPGCWRLARAIRILA
jgi:hypothetical protein